MAQEDRQRPLCPRKQDLCELSSHLPQLGVRPRIPLAKIDAVVAANLGPARVSGNAQPNAMYRHIAMYLCKHVGGWSTARVGKFYNGRDHSTVSYAIRRTESRRPQDPQLDALQAYEMVYVGHQIGLAASIASEPFCLSVRARSPQFAG